MKFVEFSSQEIELLLGQVLQPIRINIIPKASPHPQSWDVEQFESFFHIKYLSHPKFKDAQSLQAVVRECPWWIRSSPLGQEIRDLGLIYQTSIWSGLVAPTTIKWINDEIGYGLFANASIPAQSWIGIYTGHVRRLYRRKPDQNAYCVHYPTRFWSWHYYVIDAYRGGNELRFVNHHLSPNLEVRCLEEKGLLYFAFFSTQEIAAGEQLTVNYGEDYWQKRRWLDPNPNKSC